VNEPNFIEEMIHHFISYQSKKYKLDMMVHEIFEHDPENFDFDDDIEFDWFNKSITLDLKGNYPKEKFKPLFDLGISIIIIRKHLLESITLVQE
jgi:hypothetical protein